MNAGQQPRGVPGSAAGAFAVVFGLFLGLTLLKFGNPIILDGRIQVPSSPAEAWSGAWPPRWGLWLMIPLLLFGGWVALRNRESWKLDRSLWLLPLAWFGWQLVSASRTVDPHLTGVTVWHFAGCLAFYFAGAQIVGSGRGLRLLLIGVLAALTFCLVRAADQRLVEFPRDHRALMEAERTGWTNFPRADFIALKREGTIIATNGVDVVNPPVMAKYAKRRVHGTLVYPNALAGAIVLLLPMALTLAVTATRRFGMITRWLILLLTVGLGGGGLFWTGSKSGWLIAMTLVGVAVFRLNWGRRAKQVALVAILMVGFAVFAVRFHGYFAAGAASVGARFDYWRAAVQVIGESPLTGSGPGTFQQPYSRLRRPDAEMTKLVHNDFLEQFCDSGVAGGLAYAVWIGMLVVVIGMRVWGGGDLLEFAGFLGVAGWFAQGLVEFGLYIPAVAWLAFTLAGCLVSNTMESTRGEVMSTLRAR